MTKFQVLCFLGVVYAASFTTLVVFVAAQPSQANVTLLLNCLITQVIAISFGAITYLTGATGLIESWFRGRFGSGGNHPPPTA